MCSRRCFALHNFTCTSRHVFLILAVPVSFHAVLPLIAWLGFRTIHHLPQILNHENHLHRVLPGPVVGAPFQRDDTPTLGSFSIEDMTTTTVTATLRVS